MKRAMLVAVTVLFICKGIAMSAEPRIKYSETKTIDHVDEHHGVKVADPYRWLEDDVRKSKDVADWVEAKNKETFGFLETIPRREAIKKRLTELWDFERFNVPFKQGGRYYYFYNSGLQNQDVLYVQDTLDAPARVLMDPNTFSKDGTVALSGTSFSDDGKYVAYGIAEAGSDWNKWKILDIASGKTLDEELKWIKFNTPTWTLDGKGFFYARYPEPTAEFQGLNLNQKVYFHRVGTSQAQDELVYEHPEEPKWGFGCEVTEDGNYLVITIWKGTDDKYRVVYRDLAKPGSKPVDLVSSFDNEMTFIGNEGPTFFFQTDLNATRRRVIAVDTRQPEPANWKELIPQTAETLKSVGLVGNSFVANYLKDAKTQIVMYSLSGERIREVELPGIGTAAGFAGKKVDTETFYSFTSFATPPTVFRYDFKTGRSTLFRQAKVKFNPADFEVKQVFYASKDGTRVPLFLVHKQGLKLDGQNPTLLYGYGGFNISLTPAFSISRLAWVEMGGVLAVANLRGGGEYGEEWHKAGTKLHKQNVFDDFISAAEWLIANKYTSTPKLAIQGGSNGGLLVGACMTQRPDLFGACLPAVGVMDMLRFHKFTAGRFWVDDYGSADNAEEFAALLKYSPYHNIKPGVKYPATLVTTADTDDRVVPGHSFKFAARLQAAQAGDAPTLIRIETRAGHGAGKPTAKIIEEVADLWGFLVKVLDMK